jgi:N-acetylglucosamine kinase-like BadF-type ATPase
MAELPAVLAVDGGNSKTDLAMVGADGTLLALVTGPTVSHQQVGLRRGMGRLRELAEQAAREAGMRRVDGQLAGVLAACLAGADFSRDIRRLIRAVDSLRLADDAIIRNDGFATLRAGTDRRWGVAVICGSGINCVGVAADGRSATYPAVGTIAGDWGGGRSLGDAALAAAVRGRDGRGPRTSLELAVPAHFGLRRPIDVTGALYRGRLEEESLRDLAPAVFDAASAGDPVAREIIDRLADEAAVMATAMIRRLRLVRTDVEVILGGAIFRATDHAFYERLTSGITRVARGAVVRRLSARPVLGAALLGLDLVGSPVSAADRLRASF